MKKHLSLTALAILLAAVCMSFATPQDNGGKGFSRKDLQGKWTIVKSKFPAPNADFEDWTGAPTYLTFRKDGSFATSGIYGTCQGKFKLKDGQVTTKTDGKAALTFYIISMKDGVADVFCDADDPFVDLYLRIAIVPETPQQAREMLLCPWQHEYPSFEADESYIDFGKNGNIYFIAKIKADPLEAGNYPDFAGRYVGFVEQAGYALSFDENDCTHGYIYTPDGYECEISNLNAYSMEYCDRGRFYRHPQRIKYPVVPVRAYG